MDQERSAPAIDKFQPPLSSLVQTEKCQPRCLTTTNERKHRGGTKRAIYLGNLSGRLRTISCVAIAPVASQRKLEKY